MKMTTSAVLCKILLSLVIEGTNRESCRCVGCTEYVLANQSSYCNTIFMEKLFHESKLTNIESKPYKAIFILFSILYVCVYVCVYMYKICICMCIRHIHLRCMCLICYLLCMLPESKLILRANDESKVI